MNITCRITIRVTSKLNLLWKHMTNIRLNIPLIYLDYTSYTPLIYLLYTSYTPLIYLLYTSYIPLIHLLLYTSYIPLGWGVNN